MKATEVITFEEAIERGYTHFIQEEGEKLEKLSSINEKNREWYKEGNYWIVDMNNPVFFSVTAEQIKDSIMHGVIESQDVCYDEQDDMGEIVEAHDFSKVAEELNKKFEALKWFEPTDIKVIF